MHLSRVKSELFLDDEWNYNKINNDTILKTTGGTYLLINHRCKDHIKKLLEKIICKIFLTKIRIKENQACSCYHKYLDKYLNIKNTDFGIYDNRTLKF